MKQLLLRSTYLAFVLSVTQLLAVEVTSAQFVRNNIEYNMQTLSLDKDSVLLNTPYYEVKRFHWLHNRVINEEHGGFYYPDTTSYTPPGSYSMKTDNMVFGNFNNDSLMDLAIEWYVAPHTLVRESKISVEIFLNDGKNGFDLFDNYTNQQYLSHFEYRTLKGNFNGDGYDDLISASMGVIKRLPDGSYDNMWEPFQVIVSNGDGSYRDATYEVEGQEDSSYVSTYSFAHDNAVGDVNGDGYDDNYQGNHLFISNGDGSFDNMTSILPNELGSRTFVMSSNIADYNNDGFGDIVVLYAASTIGSSDTSGYVWMSNGSDYTNRTLVPLGQGRYDQESKSGESNTKFNIVINYDVNNDGWDDIVTGVTRDEPYYIGSHIQIFENQLGRGFKDKTTDYIDFPTKADSLFGEGPLYVVDINNDNIKDIVHSTVQTGYRVYVNNGEELEYIDWQIFPHIGPCHLPEYEHWGPENCHYKDGSLWDQKVFPIEVNGVPPVDFVTTYMDQSGIYYYTIIAKKPLKLEPPSGEMKIAYPLRDTILESNHIEISWEENQTTDYTVIELSDYEDFRKIYDSVVVDDANKYRFVNLEPQDWTYYWRLKGANNMGYTSYTPVRSFRTGMLTSSESENIPSSYSLRQNYPNPFNPVTQIEFAIPATSEIRLEVFDVLGRSVRVLAEGLYGAGAHSVSFDASDLPSGLYMYRLSSADYVQTRSMQLVK